MKKKHLTILDQIENEIEQEEQELSDDEKKLMKEAERKKKAEILWKAVQLEDTTHLITRVAMILNRYPETRNSDILLQIKFWQIYNNLTGKTVNLDRLFELERLTSIARARAKIQNEYKLFVADSSIKKKRKAKEDTEKDRQILDKPSLGIINLFADETGKTSDFVIVGGIWFLEPQRMAKLQQEVLIWSRKKEEEGIKVPKEFHFKDLNNKNEQELTLYKEFFDLILKSSDMISFKAIGVNRTKLVRTKISELINTLYYQLIRMGITHEIKNSRVELPRILNVTKDEEGGESPLVIQEMKQNLQDKFKIYYNNDLELSELVSMPSDKIISLQFADLFVASLNRKFNHREQTNNNKDKLANYILDTLQIEEIHFSVGEVEKNREAEIKNDHAILLLFD